MKKKKTTRKETTYFPVHKLSEMFGFVEATAFNTITGCLYGVETLIGMRNNLEMLVVSQGVK